MKLIKYEHACIFLEKEDSKLVIDPGCFTKLPEDLIGIRCVVITEEHVDHFDVDNLKKILEQSPTAKLYSTAVVSDSLSKQGIACRAISGEEILQGGSFTLTFHETDHAPIYEKSPCRSLSIKINDSLYYPSDSYDTISDTIEVVALPTSGPWHKLKESIDFVNAVKSDKIIPTHNGLYNEAGNQVANNFITANIENKHREYVYLKPGESTELTSE